MNKFNAIIDEQPLDPLIELTNKVLENISKYMQIPVKSLLNDTDAYIFGGAIRDSIANYPLNDVDILALPNSCKRIVDRLLLTDYQLYDLTSIEQTLMYTDLHVIHKPMTFIHCHGHIVQLIRPFQDISVRLLNQVDLSCCGVAYSLKHNTIIETCPGAIEHCRRKQFVVLKDNIMHQKNRIDHRIEKLLSRGWHEIKDTDPENCFIIDPPPKSATIMFS